MGGVRKCGELITQASDLAGYHLKGISAVASMFVKKITNR